MELIVIAAVVLLLFRWLSRRRVVADSAGIVGPVGWATDINWRVVRPLAGADVRRVLYHPAFVAGVLLTPLILVAATIDETSWRAVSAEAALGLVPLGWLTIIATNLVALRPRRTGCEELFAALPAAQPARSTALLATAFGPVLVAAALAGGWLAFLGGRDQELRGSPQWDEVAVGMLIVAGSVCVGVAVARWLPNPGFGVLAAIATIVIQARFLDVTTWPWDRSEADPLRFLGFLAEPTSVGDDFLEIRQAGWHLVYVGGLVVVMAAVALVRDGVRRPVAAALSVGVIAAVGAGWMQTRPPSTAQEGDMVAYLTDPVAHQICEESAGVRYCAYPDFRTDVADWRARVDATLVLLPAMVGEGRSLEVVQRPAVIVSKDDCSPVEFVDSLPPGVAARLSPAEMWPADGHVHPPFRAESFPCSERDVDGFFLAVQTAAWATGLPPAPHGNNQRCTATSQARAAIALWAGAAASADGARTLTDVTAETGAIDDRQLITFWDWDDPPMWGVDYALADAQIALAMLELSTDDVRATLERDWARWTDPETPTSALARDLGVDGGLTAPATPDGGSCP